MESGALASQSLPLEQSQRGQHSIARHVVPGEAGAERVPDRDGTSILAKESTRLAAEPFPGNLPPQKVSYLSATAGRLMEDCCSSNRP
jgi:hypothetical protein